jgi:two-component system cell cycle sensor histidine kinase/response regulator CckA
MEKHSLPSDIRGTETVLLVEDEPAVRRLISQMLLLTGYTVLEAANGPEAILLIGQCGQTVDLLLTDVVMPWMSGKELAERLACQYPNMRILFTSGYKDHPEVKEVASAGEQFLPKPFSPEALIGKVREVLDAPWAGLSVQSLAVRDH